MKVLILGSGGREHAIGWKISESALLSRLYFAPGNAGTSSLGVNLPIEVDDFEEIKTFAIEVEIDMIIVGPEVPLVKGIYDFFKNDPQLKHIMIIGASKKAAKLEGSKNFAKGFMFRHNIPTARHQTFDQYTFNGGCQFINELKPPYVLKADGLAAGKGVVILGDAEKAKEELREILINKKFGTAGNNVVIEEFLHGVEMSVFVLTDGVNYEIMPEAKDYKRIGEGDTGPNTGGMGSISPVPFADKKLMAKIEEKIIKPTIGGLKKESMEYNGFIFFGLMIVDGEPFLIEYNCRMGDPETQSVMPRIKNDLLRVLAKMSKGELTDASIRFDSRSTATVVMVAEGYPDTYRKGDIIEGFSKVDQSFVFHAGTTTDSQNNIITSGGRVLAITSYGKHLIDAVAFTYKSTKKIDYKGAYYRRDIGKDVLTKH